MSRPRSDRTASKGRPKRRAAANHLFKYQLSGNPSRAEENDLKRALQESLEETQNVGKKRSKTTVDSANSSDVSRSNNSSSFSNESAGSVSISLSKRTRSGTAVNTSTPVTKRARLNNNNNTNGTHRNKSGDLSCNGNSSNKLSPSSSPTTVNTLLETSKAIKTYSRSQPNIVAQSKRQINHDSTSPGLNNLSPSSSSASRSFVDGLETKSRSSSQTSVSKSTQTLTVFDKKVKSAKKSTGNDVVTTKASTPIAATQSAEPVAPVQDQYLKFKRESKNYAYVKMTALKVSTSKSPSNNSKSNSKKSSPNGVLNNSSTNKDSTQATTATTKASPKANNLNSGHNSLSNNSTSVEQTSNSTPNNRTKHQNKSGSSSKAEVSSRKRSPTNITPKSVPQNGKATDNNNRSKITKAEQTAKITNIPKQDIDVNIGDDGPKNDCSIIDTLDLSNKKNQNQANVKVTKKREHQGSWHLLGVPEEKVIFLRDDEPPRRLICYPAIKHVEGDVIQVRDSVLLRSGARKTDLPYIAKVCAFWEDAETGGVMMSLFWYYRPEHTEDGRKPHHLVDEVFASRHRDVDSVECIEDKCYVLTFNEYCRYRKRCKMEQVNTTWSLTDVTIPVSNESYPRRNRIPDSDVNPELVFCCRQIYDSRMKKLIKNPLINPKYGHI